MTSTPSTSGEAHPPGALPSSTFSQFVTMATAADDAGAQPSPSQPHDYSRWICIYPCYLNKAFSISDGRKIPTSLALDGPVLAPHIFDIVANKLGMKSVLQRKRHPKDWDVYGLGRVKVNLTDEKGAYINADIRTRKQLMRAVAELMKEHPMAVPQVPGQQQQQQQQQQQTRAPAKQGGVKSLPARKKK